MENVFLLLVSKADSNQFFLFCTMLLSPEPGDCLKDSTHSDAQIPLHAFLLEIILLVTSKQIHLSLTANINMSVLRTVLKLISFLSAEKQLL